MVDLERRYERYAAKWLAETESYEPPRIRETTDENLAEVLSHQHITRPAKPEEYPDIREAIARLKEELQQRPDWADRRRRRNEQRGSDDAPEGG